MTQAGQSPGEKRPGQTVTMLLAGVLGQVGCLTLLIILAALVAGLWLDNQFHTRPLFVLILVLASIPVALVLMFRLVLSLAPKLRVGAGKEPGPSPDEEPHRANPPADQP
jgi:hypothetical protein